MYEERERVYVCMEWQWCPPFYIYMLHLFQPNIALSPSLTFFVVCYMYLFVQQQQTNHKHQQYWWDQDRIAERMVGEGDAEVTGVRVARRRGSESSAHSAVRATGRPPITVIVAESAMASRGGAGAQ